jgi:hypothetical protein
VDALAYPLFSALPTFMRLPHIPRADELDSDVPAAVSFSQKAVGFQNEAS